MDVESRVSLAKPFAVMVVDDHPVVRAGIVAMLDGEADFSVVCEASNGHEAVQAWLLHRPDIGLIDLSMPGLDGIGAVRAIQSSGVAARLVIMSAMAADEDVFRALREGASGYILKDCSRVEILNCLRLVLKGQKYLQPSAAARLADRLTQSRLTSRENQVLQALAEGLSNKMAADRLCVTEGTVKTHVKAVLGKLNARSRTEAVLVAQRRGLVRPDSASYFLG